MMAIILLVVFEILILWTKVSDGQTFLRMSMTVYALMQMSLMIQMSVLTIC